VMQMVTFAAVSGPALTVTSVSPNSGTTSGGTAVTITGTNFAAGATVTFGSTAASNVVVMSGTQITATTPAGSGGAVMVTVSNPGGQSGGLASAFTYVAPPTAPGALGSNPTSLSFGSVTVGSKQSLSGTVTNTGGSSVTISQVGISGTGYGLSGITAPLTLTAGQSASFTVTFTPASAGTVSGSVTITSNASNPTLTIPLSGTGTVAAGQLTVTPTTLGLGSVVVGTSGTASGSLTASGANVTVTAASSNNSVFSVGGLSLPVTIPAGQSASFTVTFSPQTSGAASAALTFSSNAQPASTTETLTGTGTPAPTHTVNLSWNANTSSNISGYNIYRAVYTNSCGSFSKINSVLNTSTLYTDSAVVGGTSYCYATTAVNSSNVESGYSNIATNVQIP
jgi:IPT/TIG domain/Abnormal spindle-like microcephaly-assoc'd, ASPM-SPD-2-Hydin